MKTRGSRRRGLRILAPAAARKRSGELRQTGRRGKEADPRHRSTDKRVGEQVRDEGVLSEGVAEPEGGPRCDEQDQSGLEEVRREDEAGKN